MRNVVAFLAAILAVALLAGGCKKAAPGPVPEPTPIVEPTAVPDPIVATCYTPAAGAPGGGVCKNSEGKMVTCPSDTSALPECGN